MPYQKYQRPPIVVRYLAHFESIHGQSLLVYDLFNESIIYYFFLQIRKLAKLPNLLLAKQFQMCHAFSHIYTMDIHIPTAKPRNGMIGNLGALQNLMPMEFTSLSLMNQIHGETVPLIV